MYCIFCMCPCLCSSILQIHCLHQPAVLWWWLTMSPTHHISQYSPCNIVIYRTHSYIYKQTHTHTNISAHSMWGIFMVYNCSVIVESCVPVGQTNNVQCPCLLIYTNTKTAWMNCLRSFSVLHTYIQMRNKNICWMDGRMGISLSPPSLSGYVAYSKIG